MTLFALAIFLFSIATALLIAETLLPAHGALGVLAVGAMVGGIVVCYRISHALGLYVAVGLALAAPFAGAVWVKLWPKTPLGRRLVLGSTRSPRDAGAGAERAGPVRIGETGI